MCFYIFVLFEIILDVLYRPIKPLSIIFWFRRCKKQGRFLVNFALVNRLETETLWKWVILFFVQLIYDLLTLQVLETGTLLAWFTKLMILFILIHISSAISNSFQFDSDIPSESIECIDKQILVSFVKLVSHQIKILDWKC